ncbi:unnamed protein product [Macrosiphum euphorbiae]|uniref:RNA-directed DNA polymerase n=1 Tax=Macrosiphum euphorbiae TaxID=13131 RepID=A0AAV0XQ55_9HEMI|nr:unnamed protein product [Macrosiphum euphorbiae]
MNNEANGSSGDSTTGSIGNDPTLQSLLALLVNNVIQAPSINNSYQIMPDLSHTVGDFDGECEIGGEATAWLNNLNATAELHKWPNSLKLQMARRHMIGAARDWFLCNIDVITTWAEFESLFNKTFRADSSFSQRYAQMQARIQIKGESTTTYFHNKVRRCKLINLTFADTKEQILLGLWSDELSRTLLAARHMDTDELLADIVAYERVQKGRAENSYVDKTPWRPKTVREVDKRVSAKPANVTTAGTVASGDKEKSVVPIENKLRCWNCQKTGHSRRDCPSPRRNGDKCASCHWFGGKHHKSCTVKDKEEGKSNADNSTMCTSIGPDRRSGGTLHEKQVYLNGVHAMTGLIDSGSSVCILRESAGRRCGLIWEPDNTTIVGFGANAQTTTIGKTVVSLSIDEATLAAAVIYIVPDTSHQLDLLIGRPWCEAPEISYIKHGDSLTYYNTISFPFTQAASNESCSAEGALVVCDTKRIEANCVDVVTAMVNEVQIQVPVKNDSEHAVEVQANDILARRAVVAQFPQVKAEPLNRPLTYDDIRKPECLNTEQQTELLNLVNEYRSCFALNMSELGCTDLGTMDITIKPGSEPFAAKPYRVSRNEREEIQRHVQVWKDHGIVEDSTSAYAAPVLLVRKKSGESRLVLDYRRLNDQTVKQVYPLPNIDDLLEQMAGYRMFTVLDLAHAYLQIPLTSFITPDGTGQFTRMVFGLKNAPFEFTKVMDRAIGRLKNRIVINYFDDYFIPARDWEEMKERLRQVLEALVAAKLTLRPTKCIFAAKSIECLGFELSADGVRPGVVKLRAIEEFPKPKNEHEVRRFMGLASFFRRFVPKFAEKARPITELTRKETKFKWGPEQQSAFEQIKLDLLSEPVLQLFDATRPTELHTDASCNGLAGMLLQRDESGELRLVHCYSKKTSETERRYHSSKLELMAIVWALDRMRSWLIGVHVIIITDCQALVYMNSLKSTNSQITRWFDLIQEFDVEVRHRAGTAMSHVDALSRAPTEDSSDTLDDLITERLEVCVAVTEEEYVKGIGMQYSDPELREIIESLKQATASKITTQNYKLINGLLYRLVQSATGPRKLWMVPKRMRKSLVVKFHDLSGHFAVERTVSRMMERYYFPRMRRYVKAHINMCPECAIYKKLRGRQAGMLHPITPGNRPFETVNIDHLGPFPVSSKGNAYILVLVDNLTKFVKLYPSKTIQ